MKNFSDLVPLIIQEHLLDEEVNYIKKVFDSFNGYPTLEELWELMDKEWIALGCNPNVLDERVQKFYNHPVWLLNGLFIEQHSQSIENRKLFTDWIQGKLPNRVADFGGGFGGLARLVGQALPKAKIDVIEPHPRKSAVAMVANTPNVRFEKELTGSYDLIIATDVFEHVMDPIELVYKTSAYLKDGGIYLIANCFEPVIKCHLPQHYHLRDTWELAMQGMGLIPQKKVSYATPFFKKGELSLSSARKIEKASLETWSYTRILPKRLSKILRNLIILKNHKKR